MEKINRVIWIVLDSVGIGAMPDAANFGDGGANTLGHIAEALPGFRMPVLESLGLGNIDGVKNYAQASNPLATFARLIEKSNGKDTTVGHWEMAGIVLEKPFPTYPHGFSTEIMRQFEEQIGCGTLGNYPASGTAIIQHLGDEHCATAKPIVYTSADSCFQIAAHEEIIPIERLYEMCRIARKLLCGKDSVGRVIARPFNGVSDHYTRTVNRHDFSLKPIMPTILDRLKEAGYPVAGIGKIKDIFDDEGLTSSISNQSNADGMKNIEDRLFSVECGLIFANLVDFDMSYGHRRDVQGYADALTEFDNWLGRFLPQLKADDVLMITADHGCDPTYKGTDHTREYVPLLVYGQAIQAGVNLGTRSSFADIAQTLAEIFNVPPLLYGESFLKQVIL